MLTIKEEVENEYLILSGHDGELPSRQARAIIKVMEKHIDQLKSHIFSLEKKVLDLQNHKTYLNS